MRRFAGPALLVLLLAFAASAEAGAVGIPDADRLHQLRAERRSALRQAAQLKSDQAQPFGLLVIPVEFSDIRFPGDWTPQADLSPRLDGSGTSTLRDYFQVASGDRLDLTIAVAPVVRMSGELRNYSDVGYTHALRSRQLAREAITAVRDLGYDFRQWDLDGPDGRPASGDDDGLVDGVLLLHAGIGRENDLQNGWISALQYFLDEPVDSGGAGAFFFATASAFSGLGIWAHETAHLLGMEDRYDPRLAVDGASEILSRGGLGRFSLMSAGAWGTGNGANPALPDAYSLLQLGWLVPRVLDWRESSQQLLVPALESGEAAVIWTGGEIDTEYYLLETRGAGAAPYDAGVPQDRLLIYHVDESLPEGALIPDGFDHAHLRVQLIEADGDNSLGAGDDVGTQDDLFGGENVEFGPQTVPSSSGYTGASGVLIANITPVPGGIRFTSSAILDFAVEHQWAWVDDVLDLQIIERGKPLSDVTARLEVLDGGSYGTFPGGSSSILVELNETSPGIWEPVEPVSWMAAGDLPEGAATKFGLTVFSTQWNSHRETLDWVWTAGGFALDFGQRWPGDWVETRPGLNRKTGWFRWDGSQGLAADGSPVLACVDTIFADGADWPDVRYNNRAEAVLTSGSLPPGATGVHIVHAIEGEVLAGTTALDGGRAWWIDSNGERVGIVPVDGWEATVAGQAASALYGQEVWVGSGPVTSESAVIWQNDLLPLPAEGGPWKLQLVFATDAAAYRRGWFVGKLAAWTDPVPDSAFEVSWGRDPQRQRDGLRWRDPLGGNGAEYRIEVLMPEGISWDPILDGVATAASDSSYFLPAAEILSRLGTDPDRRHRLRVVAQSALGDLASRPLDVYLDGGPPVIGELGIPWPNPAPGGDVRFQARVPEGQRRFVRIYDLRGRRLREWDLPAGQHLLLWDGLDSRERRVAAGTYLMRMEAPGGSLLRKVVLLR